ncbi:hypothetical protein [Parasutterella sp.]|uniref:hypothetical protein n=3 Tax=Parasutterella TaxID=577310 RepID=UPI00307C33C7
MAQTVEAKQVVLKDSEGGYLLPYAGVAQKALKDNDGNDIPTTYAKRADLNGYLPVDGKAVDSAKADTATSAASATKATQDSAGQQINTTYIKNVSVNGRTITFTRGDGTTFTITTQDTVTTNSSNWSVSNGTNGWARDNSTGFTIQWGTADTKATWIGFPRSFSSVLSVVSGQWYNSHSGDTDNILSWNNSGYTRSAIGAFKWTWVAVGFS